MLNSFDIPILCYHSIDEMDSSISISPLIFEIHLEYLKKHDYSVISVLEMTNRLSKKQGILSKTVVLTFDDGFRNNYTQVFPLLKSLGFTATIFLATDFIGKNAKWIQDNLRSFFIDEKEISSKRIRWQALDLELIEKKIPFLLTIPKENLGSEISKLLKVSELPMLNWDEIREMDSYGIEFGAHGSGHFFLTEVESGEAENDIVRSKTEVERFLQKKVYSFCYPYGALDPEIKKIVEKIGFKTACSSRDGLNSLENLDYFALNRIMVYSGMSMLKFKLSTFNFNKYFFSVKQTLKNIKSKRSKNKVNMRNSKSLQ